MTRSDHYLSLCLSQAALSPLRYRHGCIIVRGGKVIGTGHNDYRPGYNGGTALKTGALPKRQQQQHRPTSHPPKRKPKHGIKHDHHPLTSPPSSIPQQQQQKQQRFTTRNNGFTPFEEVSGGYGNAPFSMHSEMMAVMDAARRLCRDAPTRRALEGEKVPRTKAPRPGAGKKRSSGGMRLSRGVERGGFKFNGAVGEGGDGGGGRGGWKGGQGRVASDEPGHGKGDAAESKGKGITGKTTTNNKPELSATKLGGTHSNKRTTATSLNQPAGLKRHAVLLSKSQTGIAASPSFTVRDRMKHRCLVGADLYVARLGNHPASLPASSMKLGSLSEEPLICVEEEEEDEVELARPLRTGSLHDELTNKTTTISTTAEKAQREASLDRRNVVASKPCYRCVNFMHNAGIKRVFWTNDEGRWEGAKVRDLVDQLDGVECQNGCTGEEESGGGVYVTRHEVLRLRRMLGEH
ncbi:cytidine and deoxycytidylate deaminase [Diplodia corticola]|uniref:Cytidine and deoxycytidylate deaminase n=1 Tax=Diplodia corticola TaxID=236234 RepID=A0A1J9SJ61_9PEZI|nr:cytidine and deoxycytidylate deaminase [Diplodia corticola]OJD39788.1 cytidine and deoxycytidylate deaminase [Diplodia corticola]